MSASSSDQASARVAVLLSGSGRTLANFLEGIRAGELPVEIVAVVSSRGDVRGVDIAREAGIPLAVHRRKDHPDTASHNAAINAWLAPHRPEMIVLAGYLCFYHRPEGFDGPILNIHPALLPDHGGQGMYGDRVHASVLAAGDTWSGCTVHHVTDVYDGGSIVAQERVLVFPDDDVHTLADRVFASECELYPRVVGEFAQVIMSARSSEDGAG